MKNKKSEKITYEIQMSMFENLDQQLLKGFKRLVQSHEATQESVTKIRKGLFAKNGAQDKLLDDILQRLEIIENGLCKSELKPKCEIYEMVLM